MQYHILNGDALKNQFPADQVPGSLIICRECLIDGPLKGKTLSDFFQQRATFLEGKYGSTETKYEKDVLPQFQKIRTLPAKSEIILWFGDDLFCLINMCFVLYLLDPTGHRDQVYVVKAQDNNWKEFGGMNKDELAEAYQNRQLLNSHDFQILILTWLALKDHNLAQLKKLKKEKMSLFPFWEEALQAHIDRFPANGETGRPQRSLKQIQKELQTNDFGLIFRKFCETEGIYGFGDLQVKALFEKNQSSGF